MDSEQTLEDLYEKYNISNLSYGKRSDALGDLYEEYTKNIFTSEDVWHKYNSKAPAETTMEKVFHSTLQPYGITAVKTVEVVPVPCRKSGGEPKTDVHLRINGAVDIKLSVKQSHSNNVTVAEFSADTICDEVGIGDAEAARLLEKHQKDASAKLFTADEKSDLKRRLSPFKKKLVKWVLSGSPDESSTDTRIANHTIMFKVDSRCFRLRDFSSYTIEEQVNKILEGRAGFGTGLSWTYATGSKGKRIQFKCPVL